MALGGGSRVLMAAAKGSSSGLLPKMKWKSKATAAVSPKSDLGKFMGITETPPSETSVLISKFIKLHSKRNPGIKKTFSEDKLKSILEGKDSVGITEIIQLLSSKPSGGGRGRR